jgi:hypothetical protein
MKVTLVTAATSTSPIDSYAPLPSIWGDRQILFQAKATIKGYPARHLSALSGDNEAHALS